MDLFDAPEPKSKESTPVASSVMFQGAQIPIEDLHIAGSIESEEIISLLGADWGSFAVDMQGMLQAEEDMKDLVPPTNGGSGISESFFVIVIYNFSHLFFPIIQICCLHMIKSYHYL